MDLFLAQLGIAAQSLNQSNVGAGRSWCLSEMKICFAAYRAIIPAIWLWLRGDIWKRRQWVEAAQLQASVLPPPDSDPERARSLWRSQFTPLRNEAYARLSWRLIAVKLSERDGMYISCYFAIKISKRIVRGERLNKENGTAEAALISVTWTPGLSSVCQWPYWGDALPTLRLEFP